MVCVRNFIKADNCVKTLNTPAINFTIHALVPSKSNSKLLAVVGKSQIVVVVLPRKEWSALVSGRIECRTASIGQFFHGTQASSAIASAIWHPLGYNGSTLCVLTQDAILREYDLNANVEEPVSVLNFSQEMLADPKGKKTAYSSFTTSSSSRFDREMSPRAGAHVGVQPDEDEEETEAVSLAFGQGEADWGPLTAYCLMRSGDLYAVCPYLPKTAYVMIPSVLPFTDVTAADHCRELTLKRSTNSFPIRLKRFQHNQNPMQQHRQMHRSESEATQQRFAYKRAWRTSSSLSTLCKSKRQPYLSLRTQLQLYRYWMHNFQILPSLICLMHRLRSAQLTVISAGYRNLDGKARSCCSQHQLSSMESWSRQLATCYISTTPRLPSSHLQAMSSRRLDRAFCSLLIRTARSMSAWKLSGLKLDGMLK